MIKPWALLAGFSWLVAIAISCMAPINASDANNYVVADSRDVVHDDMNGTIVRSTSGECVRTKWSSSTDECAPLRVAALPIEHEEVTHISREERTVYADFNKTDLSPEMKQRLDSLAESLKSAQNVRGVRIVGYADRIGNPGYNERLSKARAENVQRYLTGKGLITARAVDTRWLGASGSVTECPDTLNRTELIQCLQQDRRVEVEIDYTPNTQASR